MDCRVEPGNDSEWVSTNGHWYHSITLLAQASSALVEPWDRTPNRRTFGWARPGRGR